MSQFIYRLPLTDPRLMDSAFYHDKDHFKVELAKDVLNPENRIGISRLTGEVKAQQETCFPPVQG